MNGTTTLLNRKPCGNNCGKVLLTGGNVAKIFTPPATKSGNGG